MRKYIGIVLGASLALALASFAGCSDDDNGTGGSGGTGGGTGGGGGGTAPDDPCADNGGSGQVDLVAFAGGDNLSSDTVLTADCTYLLDDILYVQGGATLTIDPGVQVLGQTGVNPAVLVVTSEGMIDAQGTAEDPIVFTSASAQRAPAQWAGVVLLGTARLSVGSQACNGEDGECTEFIEGLPTTDTRNIYGGDDDSHNCGTMRYVRIEFAGDELSPDNELNSLTVGGCGTDTTLEFLQVHRGEDDGFEFFGGTVDLQYAVCSGTGDDCFDTDKGYTGTISNFIAHHFAGSSSDPRGIEADNDRDNPNAEPRANPVFRNGTIVADPDATTQQGILFRRGTYAVGDGLVVAYYGTKGIDIADTAWATTPGWDVTTPDGDPDSPFVVKNSCFAENNENFPDDDNDPDDADNPIEFFPEPTELTKANLANQEFNTGAELITQGAIDPAETGGDPDYSLVQGAIDAGCLGAFAPDRTDWTAGWTAYPAQ